MYLVYNTLTQHTAHRQAEIASAAVLYNRVEWLRPFLNSRCSTAVHAAVKSPTQSWVGSAKTDKCSANKGALDILIPGQG